MAQAGTQSQCQIWNDSLNKLIRHLAKQGGMEQRDIKGRCPQRMAQQFALVWCLILCTAPEDDLEPLHRAYSAWQDTFWDWLYSKKKHNTGNQTRAWNLCTTLACCHTFLGMQPHGNMSYVRTVLRCMQLPMQSWVKFHSREVPWKRYNMQTPALLWTPGSFTRDNIVYCLWIASHGLHYCGKGSVLRRRPQGQQSMKDRGLAHRFKSYVIEATMARHSPTQLTRYKLWSRFFLLAACVFIHSASAQLQKPSRWTRACIQHDRSRVQHRSVETGNVKERGRRAWPRLRTPIRHVK